MESRILLQKLNPTNLALKTEIVYNAGMKLTAQVKLITSAEQSKQLLDTMKQMNAAASYASRVGFDAEVYGQVSIHRLCYYDIREKFNLGAQHTVRAIGKAVEAFRRDQGVCPQFEPCGAVPLDDRLYKLCGLQSVSISTTTGRIKLPIVVAGYFSSMLSRKMGEADLVYRDGEFFLYITVEFKEQPLIEVGAFLGVDLGIVNLATDSTGETFSGEGVDRNRRRRATARKQYQRKGTRSAKRRLRKMAKRQSRYQAWVNHNISKRLVEKAKALSIGIAMENLSGLRARCEATANKSFRRRLDNWGFHQLRQFVEYKARREGIPLVLVNPAYTSQICNACGHCERANRPDQATFCCRRCSYSTNADTNAALNISALGAKCKPPSKVSTGVSSINS